MRTQTTHMLLLHVAVMGFACLVSCGGDDTSSSASPMKAAAGAMSSSAQAGASGGSASDPNDQVGSSTTAPQGNCPDGFGCTKVAFPAGTRVCLKRGDLFAPSCDASGKCPDLPMASCADPGLGTKVCSQFCEVPSS